MREPTDVLDIAFKRASENPENRVLDDLEIADRVKNTVDLFCGGMM